MLGVVVRVLDATSVNVSWIKLDSNDISSYLVHYSVMSVERRRQSGEERAMFPGDVDWGVVEGLQDGREYRFQVTATILVDGIEMEGQQRSVVSMDSIAMLEPTGKVNDVGRVVAW